MLTVHKFLLFTFVCIGIGIAYNWQSLHVYRAILENAVVTEMSEPISQTILPEVGGHGKHMEVDEGDNRIPIIERDRMWMSIIHSSNGKAKKQRYPDIICAGMEKCGTGALISFLRNHPMVKTSPGRIELHYFSAHYTRGNDHYMNLMPNVTDDELVMEKSPSYFNFPPLGTPERIYRLLPNVKIILLLCDPVTRAYSDFVHEKVMDALEQNKTFDELVFGDLKRNLDLVKSIKNMDVRTASRSILYSIGRRYSSHIITGGMYFYALKYWLTIFRKEQVLVINGEDLISQPGLEMVKIQEFVGVPKLLLPEDFIRNPKTGFYCFQPQFSPELDKLSNISHGGCLGEGKGRTRNSPLKISDESLNFLKNVYNDSNTKLYEFLGKNLGWH